MDIVFIEYKVFPDKREAYIRWINEVAARDDRLELYEGSDQPELFVEQWRGFDLDEYRTFKNRRLDPRDSVWSGLADFVPGGFAKVHVWHFHRTI